MDCKLWSVGDEARIRRWGVGDRNRKVMPCSCFLQYLLLADDMENKESGDGETPRGCNLLTTGSPFLLFSLRFDIIQSLPQFPACVHRS